jgi:predicted aspartyl protease
MMVTFRKTLNKILPSSCLFLFLFSGIQEVQAVPPGRSVKTQVVQGKDSWARATALYKAGKYQKAQDMFGRLSRGGTSVTPLYYMALCQHRLGRYKDSEHVMRHITSFFPGTQESKLAAQYLSGLPGAAPVTEKSASLLAAVQKLLQTEVISREEWQDLPTSARIPISHEHGHLMVQAKINGQACKVAFDTGATNCTISQFDFPGMFSASTLATAPVSPMMRPDGVIEARETFAEVVLPGLSRKVRVMVVDEPGVSVIGQNFFKEYSYQIDNFYIRLTKAPYSVGGALATRPGAVKAKVANHVRQNQQRFEIPFETVANIMLVDIEINGYRTKAIFDTGCATDGVVCQPALLEKASISYSDEKGYLASRLVVGPIIKMDVPVQVASSLPFPLIGPKVFDRPYVVDQIEKKIKFDY